MIVALLDFKRAPADWLRRAQALADEVDALILRAKEESAGRQWELSRQLAGLSCPVWLADRADVARAAGLSGVHLPEDGLSSEAVRSWWPDAHVSQAVHGVPDPGRVAGADLLIFGHLFETRSKPGLSPRGPEAARRVVRAASGCPVLGIGGVSAERIPPLAGTGLAGVVAADALFEAPDPRQAARALKAAWAKLAERDLGREDAT
jgi:thiazole tautomerase (transcriptional regulator TenI)